MTKVAYIHGTPFQDNIPKDEWAQRAAAVPRAKYIDYDVMTEGGMKLALLQEQLSIMNGFYPDNVQYKTALDRVSQAFEGRTVSGFYSGGTTPLLDATNKAIAKAMQKNQPAVGEIPIENCRSWSKSQFEADPRYKDIKSCFACKPIMDRYRDRCDNLNYYPQVLNQHLEKTGHHLLYKYAGTDNPVIVIAKKANHAIAMDTLAQLSGLSRENIISWYRNGVLRGNTNGGLAPLQPEETIAMMRKGLQGDTGVGFIDPVTIATVTAIFKLVVAAVGATIALIKSLRASDQVAFENTVRGIGTQSYGPEESDFEKFLSSGGDILLPLAIGAGAFFLLNND